MMKKNKKYILAIMILVVIALIAISSLLLLNNKKEKKPEPIVETEEQTNDSGPTLPDSVTGKPDGIRIAGYPELTVPAGKEEVILNLLNPEGNPCYFTFTLSLTDTGEVLYTSDKVAPGDYIGKATLSRSLSKGEYEANIHIATTSLEDGSPMNDANLDTKIIAK